MKRKIGVKFEDNWEAIGDTLFFQRGKLHIPRKKHEAKFCLQIASRIIKFQTNPGLIYAIFFVQIYKI